MKHGAPIDAVRASLANIDSLVIAKGRIAMTIIRALHGRARMRRAARQRVSLLAMLTLVPIGLRVLELEVFELIGSSTPRITFDEAARETFRVEVFLYCLGPLLAGFAFDRFGLKRTFAVVILVWAALVSLGATAFDPIAYRVLSPLLTMLLPAFVVTALLVTVRKAWPARRRAPPAAALLLVYQYALLYAPLAFPRSNADVPASWQGPMLACVTIAAILFAHWMFDFRDVDCGSCLNLGVSPQRRLGPWRAIIRDPSVWIILAIQSCLGMVWHESDLLRWNFESLKESGSGTHALLLGAAPAATFLAAALTSDRIYRQRHDWLAARRPFVVAGFIIASLVPIIGSLASQNGPALRLIDLCALAATRVGDLLVIDCAPAQAVGRYVGFVLAGELLAREYLMPPLEHIAKGWPDGLVVLIAVAALCGAGLAARMLPTLRPA